MGSCPVLLGAGSVGHLHEWLMGAPLVGWWVVAELRTGAFQRPGFCREESSGRVSHLLLSLATHLKDSQKQNVNVVEKNSICFSLALSALR